MKHWIHRLKGYLNGTLSIDNSFKYSFICYVAACIHLIVTVTFFILDIAPVYYYNILSTILYIYMAVVFVPQEKYIHIFICSIIEIVFHSTAFTLLLGWDWGYMSYMIALLPISFYLSLTLPKMRRHLLSPIILGLAICACFVITRIACLYIKPRYTNIASPEFMTAGFCLNTTTSFLIILFFSILFSIEIRQMQRTLMQENENLDEIASHDPLTGLLNRRSMEFHLNKVMDVAKKTGAQFSLIMADIDDFKKVNDTYGHDVGDQVLIHVATIMKQQLRGNDYVCRWGGEEMLLLISNNGKVATQVAERIRQALENNPVTTKDGNKITVTMTFGVTGYIPGFNINKLIKITDENLYKGKRNGKNQVVS